MPFSDSAHIIYVNGENKSKTKLGKLMHDFHCTDAKDMHYKLLADRVKYFKETQKGRDEMCAIVEDYAAEIAEKEVLQSIRQAMIKGFKNGLSKDMAKTMYPKVKKEYIDSLYQEAQKPARGRKTAKA